jgi:hypothetical protein
MRFHCLSSDLVFAGLTANSNRVAFENATAHWSVADFQFWTHFIFNGDLGTATRTAPTGGAFRAPVVVPAVNNFDLNRWLHGGYVDRDGALPLMNNYEHQQIEITHYIAAFVKLRGMHTFTPKSTLYGRAMMVRGGAFIQGWLATIYQRRMAVDALTQYSGMTTFAMNVTTDRLPNGADWDEIDEEYFDDNDTFYNSVVDVKPSFIYKSGAAFINRYSTLPFVEDAKGLLLKQGPIVSDYSGELETLMWLVFPPQLVSHTLVDVQGCGGMLNLKGLARSLVGRRGLVNYMFDNDELVPRELVGALQLALFMGGNAHYFDADTQLVAEGTAVSKNICDCLGIKRSDHSIYNAYLAVPGAWIHSTTVPVVWKKNVAQGKRVFFNQYGLVPLYNSVAGVSVRYGAGNILLVNGIDHRGSAHPRLWRVRDYVYEDNTGATLRELMDDLAPPSGWKVINEWKECDAAALTFPAVYEDGFAKIGGVSTTLVESLQKIGDSVLAGNNVKGKSLILSGFQVDKAK